MFSQPLVVSDTHAHTRSGVHFMSASSSNLVELMSGLAATGVDVIVACVRGSFAVAPHPLVPVLQCAVVDPAIPLMSLDLDLRLSRAGEGEDEGAAEARWTEALLRRVAACLSGDSMPKLWNKAHPEFQMSRAANAVSM